MEWRITLEAPFYFLIYVSAAKWQLDRAELEQIVTSSRQTNESCGVTGILLYRDGNFMQLLEGPKEAVQKTMARIREDWRHSHILVLLEGSSHQRCFPSWTMALPERNEFSDEALRKYGLLEANQVFSRIEFDKFIRILSTFGTVVR